MQRAAQRQFGCLSRRRCCRMESLWRGSPVLRQVGQPTYVRVYRDAVEAGGEGPVRRLPPLAEQHCFVAERTQEAQLDPTDPGEEPSDIHVARRCASVVAVSVRAKLALETDKLEAVDRGVLSSPRQTGPCQS